MFRLALALGCTVRQLSQRIDSLELSEWIAYHQLDPLPDHAWQTGLIASTMVNLWSKSKTTPEDFIPRVRSRRRQTSMDHYQIFSTAIATATGNRVNT